MPDTMNRRCFSDRVARLAAGLLLLAASAWGQPMYKIVTPDGKVVYSDKPPSAGQGSAQQIQRPSVGGMGGPGAAGGTAGGPAGVPPGPAAPLMPGGPGARSVPVAPIAGAGTIMQGLQNSKEMNDARECSRANAATLSLIKAAEELMRSVNNARIAGAKGASAYQNDLLERQWKYYKSLGGTASSPEQVHPPEDPCKGAQEAIRQKSAAMEGQYQTCAASRQREIRLAALSRELVENQKWLAAAEALQAEKRRNPQKFADATKGSGEWARLYDMEPAQLRAGLEMTFQEYRKNGGSATRIADVTIVPNPCLTELEGAMAGAPSRPSPVSRIGVQIPPQQAPVR